MGGRSAYNLEGDISRPPSFLILFFVSSGILCSPERDAKLTPDGFFRNVLTSLLGMKDRLDWKACAQSDEDDTLDAQNFKTAFAPFDDMLE